MIKQIYYLRKFGTEVSIDLAVAPKVKKSPHSTPINYEPHGSDILPADLEVHDVEDFEVLLFTPRFIVIFIFYLLFYEKK